MKLEIFPVLGIGEISKNDDLVEIILTALSFEKLSKASQESTNTSEPEKLELLDGDIVIVTQKIVSKAEGRIEKVETKDPSARLALARRESARIIRQRGDLIISETPHGFVCANAGVDFSNVEDGYAALLPVDPDLTAQRLLAELQSQTQLNLAVIITDTFGRPWRRGLTNVAIGSAGIKPIIDLRGETDSYGRELHVTEIAIVDELAGASEMVMGKSEEVPVAIVRGADPKWFGEGTVKEDLLRSPAEDFFR